MAAQSAADSCSARFERLTKGGRRIWYDLKVIQQPERARACGSGPKSSADRRPVDPPPVVELHVYEGPSWEGKKDITFHYNANFFLFATLEHARLIAHGRVQTPAANTPPVLSGMPVSGMAYLDRPNEAGYFLFPDLSVRHEGRYRLTFTLYEETKEDKDKDAVASDQLALEFPGGSFDFRMSVQSNDFSVFSAKKFPGLTESTSLSRTVAEQGCRVRIRRDVRMRRRDGKAGGEYDNAEDEYARRRRTETPESHRARSLSNHSVERTPYSADAQRRPSVAEYPPSHLSSQSPTGPYLQFGNQPPPQYPQYPSQHTPQSSSVPPSPSYQTGSYSQASAYPPPPQPYSYPERPPSQTGYRRPSTDHAPPPPLLQNPGGERVQRTSLHSLPPLQPPIASHRSPSSSVGSAAHLLSISSLASPIRDHMNPSKSYSINNILSSSLPPPPPPVAEPRGAKRQRDEMEPHRLVNGARQPPEDDSRKQEYMQYRRANGTTQYAPCGECP